MIDKHSIHPRFLRKQLPRRKAAAVHREAAPGRGAGGSAPSAARSTRCRPRGRRPRNGAGQRRQGAIRELSSGPRRPQPCRRGDRTFLNAILLRCNSHTIRCTRRSRSLPPPSPALQKDVAAQYLNQYFSHPEAVLLDSLRQAPLVTSQGSRAERFCLLRPGQHVRPTCCTESQTQSPLRRDSTPGAWRSQLQGPSCRVSLIATADPAPWKVTVMS